MALEDDIQTALQKPLSVRADRMTVRQHSLKDLVEAAAYLDSINAVASSATQVDSVTAVMPGVRTNKLKPGGAV